MQQSVIGEWRVDDNHSYRTDKACVVPGVTQCLDELVPSFNWEVTSVALGAEQ